jgi:hypothetical protein
LDGNAITNVDTVINEITGEEGIKIIYPHSTSIIGITGGSIVPQFASVNESNSSTVMGVTESNNNTTRG